MTENSTPFIENNDRTRARRDHLDKIQQLTGNAYPNKFARSNVTENRAEREDTITSIVTCEEIASHILSSVAGTRPMPEQLETANAALKAFGDVRVSGRIHRIVMLLTNRRSMRDVIPLSAHAPRRAEGGRGNRGRTGGIN